MEEVKNRRSLITACVISGLFLFIIVFFDQIDIFFKDLNYLLSTLFVLIFFLILSISFIKNVVFVLKIRKNLKPPIYMPSIIYAATIIFCFTLPSSEILESKAIVSAGYKGTQNQATINFRANKKFELHWSATFGYNEWFIGNYSQNRDTLFLKYEGSKPYRFGEKILIKNGSLVTLDKPKDSDQYFVPFKIFEKIK